MAEAIALVGLAASILTFLDVSAKVIVVLRECKVSARSDRFHDIEVQLPLLCETFKGIQDDIQSQKINPATADALKNATDGCVRQAKVIEELIKQISVDPAQSKVRQLLGAGKRIKLDRKLTDAWRILETYKTTMTMYLVRENQVPKPSAPTPQLAQFSSFNVPMASITRFIGRESILGDLRKTLYPNSTSPCRSAVLHGMGGQGKTQIALEFYRQAIADSIFESIYWINCTTTQSLLLDYETLAARMTDGKAKFPDANAAVQYVLERLSKSTRPWLLVFDNLDAPAVFQDIKTYVPATLANGSTLFISRHADTSRLGTPFHVGGLSEDEAVQLLLGRSQIETTDDSVSHAKEIVKTLGFSPLALDQAASYIHSRRLPLADFMATYAKRKAHILRHTPMLWEYKKDGSKDLSVTTDAFTTWELSMALLLEEPDGPAIERMLTLSAFFDNQSIHSDLFKSCVHLEESFPQWVGCISTDGEWDEYKFQDIIANLLSLSLIQSMDLSSSEGVSYTLHPLIRDWIQHRLLETDFSQYAHEAVDALGMTLQQADFDQQGFGARKTLIANADACLANANAILSLGKYTNCETFLVGLEWVAHCYVKSGRYATAKDLYDAVLHIKQSRRVSIDHLAYTSTAMSLASVCNYLNLNDQAKTLCEDVVKNRETQLGRDHEATQHALHGLATTEFYLKNHPEAIKIFESLLETRSFQSPERREQFVRAVGQLAIAYYEIGNLQLAQTCFEQSLIQQAKSLGPFHPTTLIALEGLAIIYRNVNRLAEAIKLYTVIQTSHENAFGLEHPRTLRLGVNHGIALFHADKQSDGIRLFKRSAAGFEALLGASHPDTIWSKKHLANATTQMIESDSRYLVYRGQRAYSDNYLESQRQSLKRKFSEVSVLCSEEHAQRGPPLSQPASSSPADHVITDARSPPSYDYSQASGNPSRWRGAQMVNDTSTTKNTPPTLASSRQGWTELNAVFDLSSSRNVASITDRGAFGFKTQHKKPEKFNLALLIQQTMQYTQADVLETLKQYYKLGPNEVDTSGWTSLHRAVLAGDLEALGRLLGHPSVNVDSRASPDRETPFMKACEMGNESIVAAILAHRPPVDCNAEDSSGRSVLMYAVYGDFVSARRRQTPDTSPIVKLLLDTWRVDVHYLRTSWPSIMEQFRTRRLDIQDSTTGTQPQPYDTALAAAAGMGNLESVRLLVAAGARDATGSRRETALIRALTRNQGAIARFLVENADSDLTATNEQQRTCLHLAANAETCRFLLQSGAGNDGRINAVDSLGRTALHEAANADIVKALVQAGADMSILDEYGRTALMCAIEGQRSEVVEALVGFPNAQVDVPAENGMTPFEGALYWRDEKTLRSLIKAGATVDPQLLRRGLAEGHEELFNVLRRALEEREEHDLVESPAT